MKVLFTVLGNGADPTIGGSLSRTINIAKNLSKDISVTFLTTSGGKTSISTQVNNPQIINLPTFRSTGNSDHLFFIKQFTTYVYIILISPFIALKIPYYDLVYLDSDGPWDSLFGLWYKVAHPTSKIVSMNHHLISMDDIHHSYSANYINLFLQKFHYLISRYYLDAALVLDTTSGDEISIIYQKLKIPVYRVKNGINWQTIKDVPAPTNKYTACVIGYLRPSKGLFDLVPVWKEVVKEIPEAKILIVGDILTSYKKQLHQEIAQAGLQDKIIFTGYIESPQQMIKLIKSAKIFLSLSHTEGWGITNLEALAAGLTGVVWNLPVYKSLLKQAVLFADPFENTSFARQVIKLLTDKKLFKELQSVASSSVKRYDWSTVANIDYEIYQKILEN